MMMITMYHLNAVKLLRKNKTTTYYQDTAVHHITAYSFNVTYFVKKTNVFLVPNTHAAVLM